MVKETPPRAWGRPADQDNPFAKYGNTPTCVGKTTTDTLSMDVLEKHPHVRGEDVYPDNVRNAALETPPRAWGRHASGLQKPAGVGNTPTCVGKTEADRGPNPQSEKHPHVRGEDP